MSWSDAPDQTLTQKMRHQARSVSLPTCSMTGVTTTSFRSRRVNSSHPARRLIEPDEELDHDEVQLTRGIFIRQKASRRVFTPSPRQTLAGGQRLQKTGRAIRQG